MTSLAELFLLIYITVYDIIGRVFHIDYVTLYDTGKAFPIYLCDVVWHHWQSFFHWYTWRCMTSLAELFPLIYVTLYDIGRTFPIAFCDFVSHHWQSFSHLFLWHCMTSLAELFPFIYVTLCDISGTAFCIYLCDVISHQRQSFSAYWFMWCCTTSCLSSNILCIAMWNNCLKHNISVCRVSLSDPPAWVPICCASPCGTTVLNILLEFQYVVHHHVEQLS